MSESEDTIPEIEIPPDVTEKLNELMSRYEEKYKYVRELPEPVKLKIFYDLVKNKAELDLKNQPQWKSKQFVYDGEMIDNDVPGNIMYGYMGKVFGFSDTLLYAAAGYAQKQAGTSKDEWNNFTNFGDDPRDTERIKQGIEIYNERHKRKNGFISMI